MNRLPRILAAFLCVCIVVASPFSREYVEASEYDWDDYYDDDYYDDYDDDDDDDYELSFTTEKIIFEKNSYYLYWVYLSDEDYYTSIKSVVSSNKKVATVSEVNDNNFCIQAKKVGKANITVTDINGKKKVIPVTVKDSFFKSYLKKPYLYIGYGLKRVDGYTIPGAKATLKIAGKTYKAKANRYGRYTFKLKKLYKVKQKYTITIKYGKYSGTNKKQKVANRSSVGWDTYYSCRNYVPVIVYNTTKGDRLTVSAKGEKHTYKIPISTYRYKKFIYFKKNMAKYSSFTITVKNKFGQKLASRKVVINWR